MQTRTEALNEIGKIISDTIIKVLDNNLRSCLNCINFDEANELCNIYKQRPPARIIAKGCEQWFDDIPF
jgi:Fe-S-cluster containining protein